MKKFCIFASKSKNRIIGMKRYTIAQLQQMRESEDHVEFKKGEYGNVSYNGGGKERPKTGVNASWAMLLHSVMRVVAGWLSVCTTSILIK